MSSLSGTSVTSKCTSKSAERFGKKVVIVDTPGIFDTKKSNQLIQNEIYRCIGISSPGPHAFVLVISIANRFTPEEQQTVDHFVAQFGEKIFRYFFVIFTRKDDLVRHRISLRDHIKNSPAELVNLIEKCGGRALAFDNTLEGEKQDSQVKEFLNDIFENLEKNGGECYTDEMYKEAEREIQRKEKERNEKEEAQRKQELEIIEKRLEQKYAAKFEQEVKKLQDLKLELEKSMRNQEEKTSQIATLKIEVEGLEKQLKETKGKEKKDIKQTIDTLRNELDTAKKTALKEEHRIKDLNKAHEEMLRNHMIMKSKQVEEIERAKQDQLRIQQEKIREELRKEIEEKPSMMGTVVNAVSSVGGFIKSLFWG